MEAPLPLPRGPGLSDFAYSSRAPMSTIDRNIIILTASLFGVLLLALLILLLMQRVGKCLQSLSMQPQHVNNALIKPAPPGMTKRQLDALPCTAVADKAYVALPPAATSASDCAICLADFAKGEQIRVLPSCQHGFHVGCIDTWLLQQSTCPICRERLTDASTQRLVQVRIIITPSPKP